MAILKGIISKITLTPVYLTKSEVNAGACVVAPYKITNGKLNSIVITGHGSQAVTDIALGSLTINDETTVADFSNAVVQNNKDFEYGDQITDFLLTQHINTVTCTPIADVEAKCATPHGT